MPGTLLVYNPAAGSTFDPELSVGAVVHRLAAGYGESLGVLATRPDFSGVEIFQAGFAEPERIVVIGGDGTIRRVLGAVYESGKNIPVGIVPGGTGNQLARNLGLLPENPLLDPVKYALDAMERGQQHEIDLGRMNNHYFCVGVGAGPLSDAVLLPSQEDKANWLMLAYVGSLMQNLAAPALNFKITADDTVFKIRAAGVFVTNVGDLGMATISKSAELNDGLLDMAVITLSEFSDYLRLGFHVAAALAGEQPGYYMRKVKRVLIEVDNEIEKSKPAKPGRLRSAAANGATLLSRQAIANVDGDECGITPMLINVIPQAVKVFTTFNP